MGNLNIRNQLYLPLWSQLKTIISPILSYTGPDHTEKSSIRHRIAIYLMERAPNINRAMIDQPNFFFFWFIRPSPEGLRLWGDRPTNTVRKVTFDAIAVLCMPSWSITKKCRDNYGFYQLGRLSLQFRGVIENSRLKLFLGRSTDSTRHMQPERRAIPEIREGPCQHVYLVCTSPPPFLVWPISITCDAP